MSTTELWWMSKLSLSGQRCGTGPANQVFTCAIAPPYCSSACRMVLCDMETPKLTVGGGPSSQGAAATPSPMPERLQSLAQSYSLSTTLSRLARHWNDVPVWRMSYAGQVCDRIRRVANDFAHLA